MEETFCIMQWHHLAIVIKCIHYMLCVDMKVHIYSAHKMIVITTRFLPASLLCVIYLVGMNVHERDRESTMCLLLYGLFLLSNDKCAFMPGDLCELNVNMTRYSSESHFCCNNATLLRRRRRKKQVPKGEMGG